MKGKLKQLLLLFPILIFMLFAACFCISNAVAFADDEVKKAVASIGGKEYTDLSIALSDWTQDTTLTLLADCTTTRRITVEGDCTLDLNGYTLSTTGYARTLWIDGKLTLKDGSEEGGGTVSGNGIRVNGILIVLSGNIANNASYEDGGGVFVSANGRFQMDGGSISNNSAKGSGGGVYVSYGGTFFMNGGRIEKNVADINGGGVYAGGNVMLGGNAVICENTSGESKNNLYLPENKKVSLLFFAGSAGISMQKVGLCAEGALTEGGELTSDDPVYVVHEEEGEFYFAVSELKEIEVSLKEGAVLYPTTPVEALSELLAVAGINANGAPYPERITFRAEGTLLVGESDITVTATGVGGEEVVKVVSFTVSVPALKGIRATYSGEEAVYYDTPVSALYSYVSVTGTYSDGISRTLYPTAEATKEACGEDYIGDYFVLSGSLSERIEDRAYLTVSVGALLKTTVEVSVAKREIDVMKIAVYSISLNKAEDVKTSRFVPVLPAGVSAVAMLNGAPLNAAELKTGNYTITIVFSLADGENYALSQPTRTATLTVNAESAQFGSEEQPECIITAEGGILPTWIFTVTEIAAEFDIGENAVAKQAVEVTLRRSGKIVADGELDRPVTVKLLLNEKLREKEVSLYHILADGKAEKVLSEREGDYLIFRAESVAEAQYAVAVGSGYTGYLIGTLLFGGVCLVLAVILVCYFVARDRKKR